MFVFFCIESIHVKEMIMQLKHTRKASSVSVSVSKKLTLAIFLLSRQHKRDLWKRFSSNLPYVTMHSDRESITQFLRCTYAHFHQKIYHIYFSTFFNLLQTWKRSVFFFLSLKMKIGTSNKPVQESFRKCSHIYSKY